MDKLIEELTYFAYDGERDFFDITRSEAKSFLNELGKKDDEIERLHSIIKEVREYIETQIPIVKAEMGIPNINTSTSELLNYEKILGILDKENKE